MKASKCWTTTLLLSCACALVPAEAKAEECFPTRRSGMQLSDLRQGDRE
jgi:hypothetical protein